MKDSFTIGSRGSRLALWQAEWVKSSLERTRPGVRVRVEVIKTSGDVMRDVPLSVIGGQGVFTKEIEEALLAERIDIAVHSLKDLPTTLPEGLAVAAVTEREDPRDALVLPAGREGGAASVAGLRAGAVVGTSSPRRQAQLRHLRPDIELKDLRGNVDTRLKKLDAGWYDAIVLASAGLRRLGFEGRISASIDPAEMLPAVGQGALGIETRAADGATNELVALLDDAPTRAACTAERSLLFSLGGGCQVPIAAHATVAGSRLRLEALVAGAARVIRDTIEDEAAHAARAGERLAARLREMGADDLLAATTG
ncbi:MAG TPA: hydroxymethylbilane synthase [Pyrinomonadaceae bacterium]|jgi:hydroxymethylbilane synthase|nr:hydroxymethylbilane synthase [Pyrinomonadaceae bacterium]